MSLFAWLTNITALITPYIDRQPRSQEVIPYFEHALAMRATFIDN